MNKRGGEDEDEHEQDVEDSDGDGKSSGSSDEEEESELMNNLQEKDRRRSRTVPTQHDITKKLEQYYRETKMFKQKCDVFG